MSKVRISTRSTLNVLPSGVETSRPEAECSKESSIVTKASSRQLSRAIYESDRAEPSRVIQLDQI